MGNRLRLARKLAKSNNMDFREDYIKRFNKNVKPHDFKEGMLVFLHRPDLVTVNPKLTTEWFGPFVILSMVNEYNALIQELSNKKTKFVNVNRLRKYHSSISEWNKFKVIYDKNLKEKNNSRPNDATATAIRPASAPRIAEFEADNEVVCLNPDVTLIPKMGIKEEVPEEIESLSDHGRSEEEFNPQNVDFDQHSHPTTSRVSKGRDVPGQTGTGRPVVPLSQDKKVSLSRCPFVPGQKSFACPGVPLSRDKGRSKCPGTNSSVPGRPGTK